MSEHIFTHVMLDLETMGKGPEAAIVAIGAVAFDIETAAISPRGFYVRVDLKSAVEAGGVMDPDTVIWWLQQSEAARAEITRDDIERRLIVNALLDFRHWLKTEACGEDSRIWGNGAAFDNVILRRAYQRLPLAVPWSHWNDRCYRTIKGLYGRDIKIERTGVHHHALSDAEAQAAHLLIMLHSKPRKRPKTSPPRLKMGVADREKGSVRPPIGNNSRREIWSGQRDSNPRPSAWEADALPLSYARSNRSNGAGGGNRTRIEQLSSFEAL